MINILNLIVIGYTILAIAHVLSYLIANIIVLISILLVILSILKIIFYGYN